MAKISKNVVEAKLRGTIFGDLINGEANLAYQKINDRQYGVILVDANGVERYCRVGVIVAEEREDMTARDLMESEIAKYQATQAKNAERAKDKEAKIARDKKAREDKKKKEEEGE